MQSRNGVGRLLGRSAELDAVRARLARASEGACQVVLIEGEPGIGKTRFVAEVRDATEGFRWFHAEADELERIRPFGPLVDAFGCKVSSEDPLAAEIAELIEDGANEFRIVERFAELLERIAVVEGPVVVAVDDLQWADPSTLTSLRFAARHLVDVPVAFIVALRPAPSGHELARFVDTSIHDGALRVVIAALDDSDVDHLVEGLVGRPPGPMLRSLVATATGNPFYVTELVTALDADGRLENAGDTVEADTASVPVAFHSAVVRYLRFLGESRLSLLRWAAVLGNRFPAVDVAAVARNRLDEVVPVLEEAVRAGILVGAGDRFAFRHELLREALYEDMGEAVRRSRHLEAGHVLAAAGAAPRDVVPHFVRAPTGTDETAAQWLLTAARQVIHLGTKAELLENALDRLPAADPRRVEIGAQAVSVFGRMGRMADAEALADRLRSGADQAGADRLSIALTEAFAHRSDVDGVLRHRDAVRDPSALPPRDRIRLHVNEAVGLLTAQHVAEAEAAARRAIEISERSGVAGGVHVGRGVLCLSTLARGRGRDAAALGATASTSWPGYGEFFFQMALLNEDRLSEAEALFKSVQPRIADSGYLTVHVAFQAAAARAALFAGRLDDAVARAETALGLAEQVHVPVPIAVARGVLARVALHHGSLTDAQAALGPVRPAPGLGVDIFEWARALTLEARGDQPGARQALHSAWERLQPLRYAGSWTCIGPDLVRLHLAAGEHAHAVSVAADVELGARGSDAPSAAGSAARCRALVEASPTLMRQALEHYERGPRTLETARAREDAASLIDGTDGVDQLRAALTAYEASGATTDATRVRAALRSRGVRLGVRGSRQRPATGWDSLTPTEQRVVALAAEGLTSRQIAERLYISTFTVGSHLRHVYQKLGINTRAQLTAQATRHHPNSE